MKQNKSLKNAVEWTYQNETDITIGEQKMSPLAKIIATFLALLIIGVAASGFVFRIQIYDFIVNPGLVIPNKTVEVEVNGKLDFDSYYIKSNNRVKITDVKQSVDVSKVGTYEVTYYTKNSVSSNKYSVTVNVVDKDAPTLELSTDVVVLTRGSEDLKNFDPSTFIKDYKDNYDKKEDLKLTYTESINPDRDVQDVVYSVVDKSDNETIVKLKLVINKEAEKPKPTEPSNNSTPQSNGGTVSHAPSGPYINGVHDITIPVGSDFGALQRQLISGVRGSGYVSVDFSKVNLTIPGSYSVVYSSSDGVTKTATVTVTQ